MTSCRRAFPKRNAATPPASAAVYNANKEARPLLQTFLSDHLLSPGVFNWVTCPVQEKAYGYLPGLIRAGGKKLAGL